MGKSARSEWWVFRLIAKSNTKVGVPVAPRYQAPRFSTPGNPVPAIGACWRELHLQSGWTSSTALGAKLTFVTKGHLCLPCKAVLRPAVFFLDTL